MSEVTKRELEDKFVIQHTRTQTTSWVKYLELSDRTTGEEYTGRLKWDTDTGYEIIWDTQRPKMSERPEFEYILDCITEDRESRYVI